MGTTAEKLAYLEETKSQLKSVIQEKFGISFESDFRTFVKILDNLLTQNQELQHAPVVQLRTVEGFEYCEGLLSIELPETVTFIGYMAFYKCVNLTHITLHSITPPTLANVNAFNDTNDCPIYVPAESVNAYKGAQYWSHYADRIQAIPT